MADSYEQDVVDVLTSDHREVTDLVAKIQSSQDPEERRELADTMIGELVRHSVAEEMHVYPAMKEQLPDGESAVEHDIEEHQELETTMKDLESVDAGGAHFTELMAQLEATLRDHVADEETDHFPKLRARIPRDEMIKLAEKVETVKKLAPTRPHPDAPNSELFHKMAGPGVGMVDRLRDKLSGRSAT